MNLTPEERERLTLCTYSTGFLFGAAPSHPFMMNKCECMYCFPEQQARIEYMLRKLPLALADLAALERKLAAVTRERDELQRRVDAVEKLRDDIRAHESRLVTKLSVLDNLAEALAPKETT